VDLLAERTQASPEELRSVLRALVSRLDVSLRSVIEDLEGLDKSRRVR
jgi:hypothetical protein